MRSKVRSGALQTLNNWLELPPNALGEYSRVVIIGVQQMIIENYLELLEFSSEQVRIRLRDRTISVIGKELLIRSVVAEEMIIEGQIVQVHFTPA